MSASTVKPMKRPGAQTDHEPTRTTRIGPELEAMKRGMALHTLHRASELLAVSEFKDEPIPGRGFDRPVRPPARGLSPG